MSARIIGTILGSIVLALIFSLNVPAVLAESVDSIRIKIEDHNAKIKAIEEEIEKFERELQNITSQKQSLQTNIKSLDVSRSQMEAQIKATQNKISAAQLELEELAYEISDTENVMSIQEASLAQSIRTRVEFETTSLVEQLLAGERLSDAWEYFDQKAYLEDALAENLQFLKATKTQLTEHIASVDETKKKLSDRKVDLGTQKKSLDVTRQEKQTLLTQTNNQESAYQALITTKKQEQASFESLLSELEDSLKSITDPSSIPSQGSGVLSWPYTKTFMASCVGKQSALGNPYCITQYFGNTPFATKNPQVYNGAGHSGVDFGSPVGTPIVSVLSGTVTDTGNTDAIRGCYSFGKWVVVKHGNGLSSLYAHLSSIVVSPGQAVSTGEVIGYSGMTGYATGPHLHFGLYASQALQITTLSKYRGGTSPCANAKIPVAPKDAYLNPMSYF